MMQKHCMHHFNSESIAKIRIKNMNNLLYLQMQCFAANSTGCFKKVDPLECKLREILGLLFSSVKLIHE